MELTSSAERNRLFDNCAHGAFHLELRDDYSVPIEDGPYASWLRGEPLDHTYLEPWTQLVKRVTDAGKTVRRVRVVTQPHTPYIQWEYVTAHVNEEAGESVRWYPRHQLPEDLIFPVAGHDWWLFDDSIIAVGHFSDSGRFLGNELIDDPAVVADCVRVRDLLWVSAVPHSEYKP